MIYRGIVERGEGRGVTLGFPTANIALGDSALSGIYAARVVFDARTYAAAAYADQRRNLLEAYILDFSGDEMYDKEIQIELLEKIRDDKRFEDESSLREQIQNDIDRVRDYFKVL